MIEKSHFYPTGSTVALEAEVEYCGKATHVYDFDDLLINSYINQEEVHNITTTTE